MIERLKIRLLRRFLARHRFLLYVETVLIWVVFVAAIFYAISFFIIPTVAEAKLHKLCGGVVDIHSGRISGLGSIRLAGVTIAENETAILYDPVLQADRVDIEFGLWKLLKWRFEPHTIVVSDVLVSADYDLPTGKWNLAGLSFQKSGTSAVPVSRFEIQRGAVRFRRITQQSQQILATVGLNGQISSDPSDDLYSFTVETDGRFGFGPSKLQGSVRKGKKDEPSQLLVSGQVTMPDSGILSNKWDLTDIQLEAAFDETMLTVKELAFDIGPGSGRIDAAISRTGSRPMELNIGLHGLTLSDGYAPGTISYRWLIDSTRSGFARFLKRFNPVGAGELDLSIQADLDDLSNARLNGVIQCRDIAIRDEKFPYRIEKMQGPIVFEDHLIRLKEIQARHGEVNMQVDGWVDNTRPKRTIDFHITSSDMRFDHDLHQSLSPRFRKAWSDFTPEGLTRMDYYYFQKSDGQEGKQLTLDLAGVKAMYKHFPYPLQGLTGRIVLGSQQLLIENVRARYENGGHIKVDGQILQPDDAESVFDVRIQGRDIPVDSQLVRALPLKYRTFFDRLQVDSMGGISNFEVSVFPDKSAPQYLDYSTRIQVKADAFEHADFPMPMTDVEMAATISGDAVQLDAFQAKSNSGPVRIGKSQLWSQGADPNRPGFCLELDLKDFDLNESFWESASQDLSETLGKFALRGKVNAAGKLTANVPGFEGPKTELVLDCPGNRLLWDKTVIANAKGRLQIQGDRVRLSPLALTDIDIDHLPLERLPKKVSSVWKQAAPSGTAAIDCTEGTLLFGPGGLERIDVDASLDTDAIVFGDPNAPGTVEGSLQGTFAWDRSTGRCQAAGEYDMNRLIVRDRVVTGLSGRAVFDPNTTQFKADAFSASLCGGSVSGDLTVSVLPDTQPGYALELNYSGIDVQTFMGQKPFAASQGITHGSAAGRLALEGSLGDLAASRGTLDTTVIDLKMGNQSLLGKILTAVQLKKPENFVFSEIDLDAAILGHQLVLSRLRMLGNPLIFYGSGKIDFQSRQIDLNMASWDPKDAGEQSILDALAQGIGSALWNIQVQGTLDEPDVEAVYLSVLKHPLNIFDKKEKP